MTGWEERAFRREQEDPRRRATVEERLAQGLAIQLPWLLGVLAGILALVAGWHLGVERGAGPSLILGAGAAIVALLLLAGSIWSRREELSVNGAHGLVFAAAIVLVLLLFLHLVLTANPLHAAPFGLVLLGSAALFQDGLRLALAGAVVLGAWTLGLLLADLPPGTWPALLVSMGVAVVLSGLVSSWRLRTLRRLEALNLELRAQIGFDALTGVANRRAFQERLDGLWRRLSVEGEVLSLILMDLDHFKNLNDTRGHAEGDAALRQMGGVLRMAVRSTEDLPARLGGEEFAVLLPRTRPEHGLMVAERIRQAVTWTTIPNPGAGEEEILTASLGVATLYPSEENAPADLLARADAALYRAKEEGRNRVVVDRSDQEALEAMDPSLRAPDALAEGAAGPDPDPADGPEEEDPDDREPDAALDPPPEAADPPPASGQEPHGDPPRTPGFEAASTGSREVS